MFEIAKYLRKTYFVTGSKSQVYSQLFVRLSVGLRPTFPHTQSEDMACLLLEPISKGKETLRLIIMKQGVIKK